VYASSMLGPLAGVNFRISLLLFLDGLTLEDGLLLNARKHLISPAYEMVVLLECIVMFY